MRVQPVQPMMSHCGQILQQAPIMFRSEISSGTLIAGGILAALLVGWGGFQLGTAVAVRDAVDSFSVGTAGGAPKASGNSFRGSAEEQSPLVDEAVPLDFIGASGPRSSVPGQSLKAGDSADLNAEPEPLNLPGAKKRPAHLPLPIPDWPLILKTVDLGTLGLSSVQVDAIRQLQEQFVQDVGGPDQDPADPDYLNRWISASFRADDLLRAKIGWTAFNAYTIEAARARGGKSQRN